MKIFISFSSQDRAFVNKLSKDIEAYGFDIWLDENEILGSDIISKKIKDQIKTSDYFLAILSKNSFSSPWVHLEINEVLKYKDRIHIIPLRLDRSDVIKVLEPLKYIDFYGKYEDGLNKLIQSIERLKPERWTYIETLLYACDSLKRKLQKNRNYSALAIDNAFVFYNANDYDSISSDKIKIKIPEWAVRINSLDLNDPTPEELQSVIPPYYEDIAEYLKDRISAIDTKATAKELAGGFNCKVGVIKIEKPIKRLGTPLVLTVIPLSYWVVREFNRRIISDPDDTKLQDFKIDNQELLTKNSSTIIFKCPSALFIELAIITSDNMVCVVEKSPNLSIYAATNRGKWTCTVEEGAEWNKHIVFSEQSLDIKSIISRCLNIELNISENYIESVKLNMVALEFANLNTGIIGFCKLSIDSESIRDNFKKSEDFKSIPVFTPIAEINTTYFENSDSKINWHPTARLRLHTLKEYIKSKTREF